MDHDSLQYLPADKWKDLEEAFESDGARGATGVLSLTYIKVIIEKGLDYGFKVYCPYGDVLNGMIAVNIKDTNYELLALCPKNDTSCLEKALDTTKLIDWTQTVCFPFAPKHVQEVLMRTGEKLGLPFYRTHTESYIIRRGTPLFEDISLPPNVTFGLLAQEHAEVIDSVWPHRYQGSIATFQLLIRAGLGYGIFVDNQLAAWLLIREVGFLTNLFTLEQFRRNGYAEILLKLVSNEILKKNQNVVGFCVYGNYKSCNLFRKIGFERFEDVAWCFINSKRKGTDTK